MLEEWCYNTKLWFGRNVPVSLNASGKLGCARRRKCHPAQKERQAAAHIIGLQAADQAPPKA